MTVPYEELRDAKKAWNSAPVPDFRAIYSAEIAYVWESLRRLGVHEADIEDLAHDVFITLFRRLQELDTTRSLRPWLFGSALRLVANYRRSARFRRELPGDVPETAGESPPADDQLEQQERRRLAMQALQALELKMRAVFVMHELDEQPMPEIAAALGVPLNTCYSRLRLARQQFAEAVKRLQTRKGER